MIKWRSEVPVIEHLVDPVTDPLQVSAINLRRPVERSKEVAVGEVIEDVVDSRVALGREVAFDGLVQQFTTLVQNGAHDAAVEGELDLVETDRRHGQSVDLLSVRQKTWRRCRQFPNLTRAEVSKNRNCCLMSFFTKVSHPPQHQ